MRAPYFKLEYAKARYYTFDQISNVLFKLIAAVSQIFLYRFVFYQSTIGSYSFQQLALYTFITYAVYDVTTSNAGGFLRHYYANGYIANFYLRPRSVFMQFFQQLSAKNTIKIIVTTIPFMIISFIIMAIWGFPAINAALFFIGLFFIAIGFVIQFALEMLIGSLVFYTKESHNIMRVSTTVMRVLGGSVFPLTFFPTAMQSALKYCPFQYTAGTIAEIYSGHYDVKMLPFDLAASVVWMIILFAGASFVFRITEKRLGIYRG